MPPAILHTTLISSQLGGKAVRLDQIAPFYIKKDIGRILNFPQQALACAKLKGHHLLGGAFAGTQARTSKHIEKRPSQRYGTFVLIFIEARL